MQLRRERGDISWSAHSPGLYHCDYFLWEYLKAQAFEYRLLTTNDLKDFIYREIAVDNQRQRMLIKFEVRFQQSIAHEEGKHLDDMIFKRKVIRKQNGKYYSFFKKLELKVNSIKLE